MENAIPYQDKLNRWSSHSQITEMLVNLPQGSKVLDVGAGTGTLARLCKGRGYVIKGIEPNAVWLGEAREYYADIYYGGLEQTPDTFLEGHDIVICADVLEHLVHPEEQLKRLVNAQPEECIFLVSVPNIANLWVRLNLLGGRFDFSDKGILDRTHLHFYTRKSFLSLLSSAGLKSEELKVTPIPIELVRPYYIERPSGRVLLLILAKLTAWWPTMLGYQWIVKARKSTKI